MNKNKIEDYNYIFYRADEVKKFYEGERGSISGVLIELPDGAAFEFNNLGLYIKDNLVGDSMFYMSGPLWLKGIEGGFGENFENIHSAVVVFQIDEKTGYLNVIGYNDVEHNRDLREGSKGYKDVARDIVSEHEKMHKTMRGKSKSR